MSFVTVRNLFKYYDRRPILENIDLEVDEGSFVSLVGASGCGKSTFLRMLLTVRDNLVAARALGANRAGRLWGKRRAATRARADIALERIGLSHVAHQYPASLSGGMQQRLAIAQALAAEPRILLLDEPFGALDPGTRSAMHDFLLELQAEIKMTIFMVSHDLEEAFKLGDRVLVFDKIRWDQHEPDAFGATITYDFDARNGGIPFQNLEETQA